MRILLGMTIGAVYVIIGFYLWDTTEPILGKIVALIGTVIASLSLIFGWKSGKN
jgi:hypothetical protein